jgi:hypothetical protein
MGPKLNNYLFIKEVQVWMMVLVIGDLPYERHPIRTIHVGFKAILASYLYPINYAPCRNVLAKLLTLLW